MKRLAPLLLLATLASCTAPRHTWEEDRHWADEPIAQAGADAEIPALPR